MSEYTGSEEGDESPHGYVLPDGLSPIPEHNTYMPRAPSTVVDAPASLQSAFETLRGGKDVARQRDEAGRTALHMAAECGDLNMVNLLIQQYGALIEAENHDQNTALHLAAMKGFAEVVEVLLKEGANVTAENRHGLNPLDLALMGQRTQFDDGDRDGSALLLLKQMTLQEVLQQEDRRELPLLWRAAMHGHVKTTEWILQHRTMHVSVARVLSEPLHGRTLLFETLVQSHREVTMLLLQHSPCVQGVSTDGRTGLHSAALSGMFEVVKHLLRADRCHEPPASEALKMRDSLGRTPLECACDSATQFQIFGETIEDGYADTIALLLQKSDPDRPNAEDTREWTPMHWAAYYKRPDLIRFLVAKGAHLEARDFRDRKPADIAQSLATCAKVTEIMEWLRPDSIEIRGREGPGDHPLTRPRPADDNDLLLWQIPVYMAALYRGGSCQTSKFSIRSVLYECGPGVIWEEMARAGYKQIGIENIGGLALSWIHLPANNKTWIKHLAQSIYMDRPIERMKTRPGLDVSGHLGLIQLKKGRDEPGTNDNEIDQDEQGQYLRKDRAQLLFARLHQFLDNSLAQDAGSVRSRFLQPHFNHFRASSFTSGPVGVTEWHSFKFDDIRISLSLPYLCFTQVKFLSRPGGSAIWQHCTRDGSTHFPLPLDDFYYHSLSQSTDKGAENQVLFRHQGLGGYNIPDEERLICMVDQLWLQVVDDGTIITSCSGDWNSIGATIDVQAVLRRHVLDGKDTRPPLLSALGMVFLAVAACIRETTDWELPQAGERLLHVFGVAVARAADKEAGLFKIFNQTLGSKDGVKPLTQGSRDGEIKDAVDLLTEIKDILDELNIIKTVLSGQASVLTDAFGFLTRLSQQELQSGEHQFDPNLFLNLVELNDYYLAYSKLDLTTREVDKLIGDAIQVRDNINHLLDLRQKHANLAEAIWAREASESATMQGRTIMVFTVVTIIFLPVTFLSSLFALDITIFPHNDAGDLSYTPGWAFSWMLGITAAVSAPLVLIAFFVNQISDYLSNLKFRRSDRARPIHTSKEERVKVGHAEQVRPENGGCEGTGRVPDKRQNGRESPFRLRTATPEARSAV